MKNRKSWIDDVYRVRGTLSTRLDSLRLDKNERTTEFSKPFIEVFLSRLRQEHFTAYPETEPLYDKLAEYLHVDRTQIVVTAGSDAGIKNCFELAVERGSKVITLSPTFAMVDIYAQLFGADQTKIGYNHDLSLQYDRLLDAIDHDTSLIVIANPNSPTGTMISESRIEDLVRKARQNCAVILIDEAYYGFSKETALPLLSKYENLVVARTFSKSAGLAGCRVGYLVAQAELAQRLYRFRPMYEVNAFGVLAAMTILEHPEIVENYLSMTEDGRSFLKASISQLGLRYRDTHANFLHVDLGERRNAIEKELVDRKILVRGGPGVDGYEQYLRISLGPAESMIPIVAALKEIL